MVLGDVEEVGRRLFRQPAMEVFTSKLLLGHEDGGFKEARISNPRVATVLLGSVSVQRQNILDAQELGGHSA